MTAAFPYFLCLTYDEILERSFVRPNQVADIRAFTGQYLVIEILLPQETKSLQQIIKCKGVIRL